MRRLLVLLVVLLLPALPAQAQDATPTSRITQVDTSAYPDITLYVSVADAAGNPLAGLTESDFAITEDGQPVTIDRFVGGGAGPINAALVIDRSGSMNEAGKMEGALDSASVFINQMRPDDRTALIAFSSDVRTVEPFTSDQATLQNAIGRIRADGGTALYDAVVAGVDVLRTTDGRRALIVLTDGEDCRERSNRCNPAYGSRASLNEAIAHANEHGQPVYVIGLGERSGVTDADGINEAVLQRIAGETGGEYFYAPDADDLATLYTRLAGSLQQEYAITYHSPRPFFDGTRRDIQVQVAGAAAIESGYVERHMIHVRSTPLVGVLLLLPIIGALLLPTMMRRWRSKRLPPLPEAAPATPDPAAVPLLTAETAHCTSCDAALTAPDAKFCSMCGSAQQQTAPARQTYCDQCGKPMRQGAKFCSGCGATAVVPAMVSGEQQS